MAACLGALVWGLLELNSGEIYLLVAVLLGIFIAQMLHLGTMVMTKLSQAFVFVLTLLSVLAGEVIATALAPMRVFHTAFSFRYFSDLRQLVRVGIAENWLFPSLYALIGAGTGIYLVGKRSRVLKRL